jgi:hypothetical protein
MKIYISSERGGGHRLRFSSPDRDVFFAIVDSLKNFFPASLREYDGQTRQWIISADADLYSWLDAVEVDYDAEVIWGDERKQSGQRSAPASELPKMLDAYQTLCLTPDAPPELVKVAYRCLAQLHHPDKASGDELRMKRLNLAFEKLKAA